MSAQSISVTMLNVFGICISEGGIQNILSQLSNYLGEEYENLLKRRRIGFSGLSPLRNIQNLRKINL